MWLADTLANLLSGLGTTKDKTTGNIHVVNLRSLADLQAAYRTDWVARKIVDVPAFDMLREWRAWQAKDKQVEAIEAAEKALRLRGKLLEGLKLARRDGGAALVIGDGSPDPAQPLVADRLPQGGIRYIAVMSRREITAGQRDRDPASEWFGEPSEYMITSAARGAQVIHPSRVIRLLGAPILDEGLEGDGWGDSVLQAVMDAVDQASSSAAYVNAMLPEAKQDVISVPGLSQHLSTAAGTKALTDRFAYAARMKSMFGMLLLEGDGKSPDGEVFEQKQISFAGLPDVVRLYLSIAAGAADIPATRLLGKSPDGQNATGDSDARNYYDNLAARQNVELTPAITRLDELLIRHALGKRPSEIWYRWNPLYQTSHKDNADAFNVIATAVKTLADAKVAPLEILAQGVKGAAIDSGLLPGIDGAYDDHGDAPLTEADPAADQYDPYGNPGEGYTGIGDPGNVIPFPGRAALGDATPRTLYVSRKLVNGDDLLAWARSQGFADLMPAGKLHVTIAYSRTAVDWMKVGQTWNGEELKISAGGPRLVERFGEAVVLLFASDELRWRWQEIMDAGASWDHPEYQPHVTFTWNAGDVDLSAVEPYNGPLVFGPEIFEPVNEDWRAVLTADAAAGAEEADDEEVEAVTLEQLSALFGEEVLRADGVRLDDKAPHHGPRHGEGPDLGAAFNELLHPRGPGGKFAPKGAAAKPAAGKAGTKKGSATAPKPTKGEQALKSAGVGHDDEIAVLSKRVKAYAGAKTVRDFVDSHPKGKAYALRKLAADHAKGTIGFKAASGTAAPRAAANPEKYNPDNFSDFSDTDHKTTIQVERDLYKQMLGNTEKQAEIGAIARYSGNGYTGINGFLRGDGGKAASNTVYANPSYGSTIRNIDGVLARSRMTEDTVVYRGVKGAFAQKLKGAKLGSVITDRGYVSTSLKGDTSKAFAGGDGVVLKMLLPKGNPAYVMNGRGASHYPKEHEILLPRKSRFRVASLEGNVLTVEVL